MEMTPDEVRNALQELYTAEAYENSVPRVLDVFLLGTGFEADVFAFSLETFPGAVSDLILRVYVGADTARKCAREFAAMSRLHNIGYPVPKVTLVHSGLSRFNRPILIMERILGVSLGNDYWSGIESTRQAAIALLYRLMAELHALQPGDILPESPFAHIADPYAILDREIAALTGLLQPLEMPETPSLARVFVWLRDHRLTVPCVRPVIVHGDFHPNNVLVRSDGVPFVIDWSNIRVGDPRSDLAWTRLITQAAALTDGGAADLAIYERHSGNTVEHLGYFEVMACMHLLLSTFASLTTGPASQGLHADAATNARRNPEMIWHVATLLQARTGLSMPDLEETLTDLLK